MIDVLNAFLPAWPYLLLTAIVIAGIAAARRLNK